MKVLVGGSTGLVGEALVKALAAKQHEFTRLVRSGSDGLKWNASIYTLDNPTALADFDAVVHLGGESIIGRWSATKKQRIRDSRVKSTAALAEALAQLDQPPATLILASATGYYGNRGDTELTEDSSLGEGFLADVCKEWEAAADPARAAGIRVVHLRYAMLLSPDGGALKTMLPPFKLGLGGKIATGKQYMSWASLDDAVHAILFALETPALEGPINVVSPNPCTNEAFTRALGRVLRRPTIFPVPAFAARLAFGEMADALLMTSQRVLPSRLAANGYTFKHPELEPALRDLLNQ